MTDNEYIGSRIRYVRTLRGMTQRDLADLIARESGVVYSAAEIGSYERGSRRIPAEFLLRSLNALRVSSDTLFQIKTNQSDQRLIRQISGLKQHEKQIMHYLITEWEGDSHILCEFCALYAALPPNVREQIAFNGLRLYKESAKNNDVDRTIKINVNEIESGWRRIADLTEGDNDA